MVKIRRTPADGSVAVVAGVAARYMRGMLSGSDNAVMTAVTGSDDLRVINGEYRCE